MTKPMNQRKHTFTYLLRNTPNSLDVELIGFVPCRFVYASNGKTPSYTNWNNENPRQPNNDGDCVRLSNVGDDDFWWDGLCSSTRPFACQRGKFSFINNYSI